MNALVCGYCLKAPGVYREESTSGVCFCDACWGAYSGWLRKSISLARAQGWRAPPLKPGTRVRVTSDRLPHYIGKIGTLMRVVDIAEGWFVVEIHPQSYVNFRWYEIREEST